ncbi:MAG: DUF2238 domain-containing protein [Methylococcaceae bacterium]|nr:DUF2238 domain-containing protein [Methylococcaceae bacterium]
MAKCAAYQMTCVALVAELAWSGLAPYDRTTWLLEVVPVFVILPLLWATRRRFPLTTLLYVGIVLHGLVLTVGGSYSYARVPAGFQMQEWLGLSRNPYDKLGHFCQGFVPALAAREILLRGEHVRGRRMLQFVVLCVALAVSAVYELLEWAAALVLGQGADEFLGIQGDPWDTQSDMFMALTGAATVLLLVGRFHDRAIAALQPYRPASDAAEDL